MKSEEVSRGVDRNMGNFCRIPLWNTTMNAKEVEYMCETYGSMTVICNGHLRDIKIDKITDNCFKISTARIN